MSNLNPFNGLSKQFEQMHNDAQQMHADTEQFIKSINDLRADLRVVVKALNDNTRALSTK